METAFSVFNYQSPRQALLDFLAGRQRQEPHYSVRRFATEMGISHTLLLMFLQGKRPLRVKHGPLLAKAMRLSSQERLFLQALLQLESATDPEEKDLCRVWLAELHPEGDFKIRELEEYSAIAHWIHTVLLAATEIPSLELTPENLHRRLKKWGHRVSLIEVRAALERLLTLGLLRRDESGRLVSTYQRVTSRNDIASRGARAYHKQTSELAIESLERIPLDRREFQSFSLSLSPDQVPLAKELIRKFRAQFAQAMSATRGAEVFQMNLQFFQLTESPEATLAAPEDEGVEWPKPKNLLEA
ncbi:MAG: TIGR02147 family protein [Oligoflexia bacterium]|nr:TIGR02147 family protein [Oligoflexia bacterium]